MVEPGQRAGHGSRIAIRWRPSRAIRGAGALSVALIAHATGEAEARSEAQARTYDDPVAYCAAVGTIDAPDARYVGPAVPDGMARALTRGTRAPPAAPDRFFRNAIRRCADGSVLACTFGANLS